MNSRVLVIATMSKGYYSSFVHRYIKRRLEICGPFRPAFVALARTPVPFKGFPALGVGNLKFGFSAVHIRSKNFWAFTLYGRSNLLLLSYNFVRKILFQRRQISERTWFETCRSEFDNSGRRCLLASPVWR